MTEQRSTPRSSAFPRAPRDPVRSPEVTAAAQAQAEAARAASVELAVHGDPSLGSGASEGASEDPKRRRLRVDWVRPTDLAARAGAGGLALGGEWNMRLHAWLRAQPRRAVNAAADGVRRLPALSRFGQSAGRQATTRSAPTR